MTITTRKILSLTTAAAFLWNSVALALPPSGTATLPSSRTTALPPSDQPIHSSLEPLAADPFIQASATIEGSFNGKTGKTVIFIQDAHSSLEAQENISKLISALVERHGMRQVFEEGYEGPVPTDEYFKISDPQLKERTAYFFMDYLLLGGAEYAHINRKTDFALTGADDFQGYLENLKEYARAARLAGETDRDLEEMGKKLSTLEGVLFPKDFQTWWRLKQRYEGKSLGLADYLSRTLTIYAAVWKSEELASRYPSLALLTSYSQPGELTSSKRRELEEAIRAIDPRILFQEIGSIEKEFTSSLLTSPNAQKLFFYLKTLGALKRLNHLEAVPEEVDVLEKDLKHFSTAEILDLLSMTSKKTFVLSSRWEDNIQSSFRFYRGARTREKALERPLGGGDWQSAVLVFGGFHKDGICSLLRHEGISYLLLSPKITQADPLHEKRYEELMEGKDLLSPLSFARSPSLYATALETPEKAATVREEIRQAEAELAKRRSDVSAKTETDQAVAQILTARGASMGEDVAEIRSLLDQGPSAQVSQAIFDRLRKILIHHAFSDYDEVRDRAVDHFIKQDDLEHLTQLIQIIHDPKPSSEVMAGRVLAIAGIVQEMERTFPEGESIRYTEGEISNFQSNLRGLLPKLQEWAAEYSSSGTVTAADLDFVKTLKTKNILQSFADSPDHPVPGDILETLEKRVRTLSRQIDRFDQDPGYQERARHLNRRLLELKFSADPERQSKVLTLMAKAAQLNPKESTPLLVYLVTQFLRYGYTVPETTSGPILDFMDIANKTREAGVIYFVRLLGQILFSAHSGQERLGVYEDERVKTRRGDYGQGIYGVLRDEIHNHMGMHVLGLLERQMEYYRTMDARVLYSKDYEVDVYRSKTAVPLAERSRFQEKIVNELDPAEDARGSKFVKALYRRLGKSKKQSFYYLLRTLPNETLQKVIDEVNQELGTHYQLATDTGGPAAYLWVYREFSGRYSVGGLGHMLDRFREIAPKTIFVNVLSDFYEEMKKDTAQGQYERALQRILPFRKALRQAMFDPTPNYSREAVLDQFVKEYGRDDIGNADGGAYFYDVKLNVYQADYYLTQIENYLLEQIFSRKYAKITRENYQDALSLVQTLSALGYFSGDYTLDQVDHAGVLVSPVPESIRTDILHLMLRETNQTDATYDRLIAPLVKRITQATPVQPDLNQFLSEDMLKKLKTPEDKRLHIAQQTLSQMRGINKEHRRLKKMLEAIQGFRAVSTAPELFPASSPARPFVVLGINSSPAELEKAVQIGRYELGAKGMGLIRALQVGIPVPPFVIFSNRLTAPQITSRLDESLKDLDKAIKGEENMGLGSQFAEGERPYFLAVRASTYLTMPGQTLTVSNIGMNEKNLLMLKDRFMRYGIEEDDALWAAADSYRRFLESYGMSIYNMPKSDFDDVIEDYKYLRAIKQKEDLSANQMMEVARAYKSLIEEHFGPSAVPDDPRTQLSAVIVAVQRSFERARTYLEARNVRGDWPGTSIIIQAMAYGNIKSRIGDGIESGAGIVYTRDPNTWLYGMNGDFKWTAQGSDLADHTTHPLRYEAIPYRNWRDGVKKWGFQLEELTGANVEMEITVQKILGESVPWLLQQRDAYLPDPFNIFTRKPRPEHILMRENEARGSAGGAYRGIAVFSPENVPSAKELEKIGGDGVVLITDYIEPGDVPLLFRKGIKGIVTKRGGYVSHTSDIARELGITAVVGANKIEFINVEINEKKERAAKIGDKIIHPGDHLSIDGRTGRVSRGFLPVVKAESLGQDPLENKIMSDLPEPIQETLITERATQGSIAPAEKDTIAPGPATLEKEAPLDQKQEKFRIVSTLSGFGLLVALGFALEAPIRIVREEMNLGVSSLFVPLAMAIGIQAIIREIGHMKTDRFSLLNRGRWVYYTESLIHEFGFMFFHNWFTVTMSLLFFTVTFYLQTFWAAWLAAYLPILLFYQSNVLAHYRLPHAWGKYLAFPASPYEDFSMMRALDDILDHPITATSVLMRTFSSSQQGRILDSLLEQYFEAQSRGDARTAANFQKLLHEISRRVFDSEQGGSLVPASSMDAIQELLIDTPPSSLEEKIQVVRRGLATSRADAQRLIRQLPLSLWNPEIRTLFQEGYSIRTGGDTLERVTSSFEKRQNMISGRSLGNVPEGGLRREKERSRSVPSFDREKIGVLWDQIASRPPVAVVSLREFVEDYSLLQKEELEKNLLKGLKIVLLADKSLPVPAIFQSETKRVRIVTAPELKEEHFQALSSFLGRGKILYLSANNEVPQKARGHLAASYDRLIFLKQAGKTEGLLTLGVLFLVTGEYRRMLQKSSDGFWEPTELGEMLLGIIRDFLSFQLISKAA